MDTQTCAPTISLADLATCAGTEAKVSGRRRVRVLLNCAGGQIMRGHTINIAVDRISLSVPSPLERDSECAMFFGLTIEDRIYSIIGSGRVRACAPNDKGGYLAELSFAVSDKKSQIALEQLFGANKESSCVQ